MFFWLAKEKHGLFLYKNPILTFSLLVRCRKSEFGAQPDSQVFTTLNNLRNLRTLKSMERDRKPVTSWQQAQNRAQNIKKYFLDYYSQQAWETTEVNTIKDVICGG